MSKAGVIGHFGSKEELQLEALAEATKRWRREVWDPVADEEPGLPRLRALARRRSAFLGDCPLPGGCFLSAASFEFDDRPAGLAEPEQVAFELNAIAIGTNSAVRLHADPDASERCHRAMERVLTR